MSSFINRLNDELRPTIKILQLATIKQVVEKAQLQELALEAIFKKHGSISKGLPRAIYKTVGRGGMTTPSNLVVQKGNLLTKTVLNPSPITSLSMEQKWQLRLCFQCGEK